MSKKTREERKQVWIAEQIIKKNAERKRKFRASGTLTQECSCVYCYHRKTGSCPGLKQGVCKYWYQPDAPVIGTAYCVEGIGAEKARGKAKK